MCILFLLYQLLLTVLLKIFYFYELQYSKFTLEKYEEEIQLLKMTSYHQILKENTQRAINWIQSCLQTLLDSKPLSNKLYTKVILFTCGRTLNNNVNLKDVSCNNYPVFNNKQ